MGKIVKYCAACEESFAEKFGFCPNCGQAMTAFEMSPVGASPIAVEETAAMTEPVVEESNVIKPIFRSSSPTFEKSPTVETVDAPIEEIEADEAETVVETTVEDEPKTFAAAAGATNGSGNGNYQSAANTDFYQPSAATEDDDAFHITVIEEKNAKQRNGLLLAATILMVSVVSASSIYSLFNRELGVNAVGDAGLFSMVVVDESPMNTEDPPLPEDDRSSGGGGGGGRKDNEPIGKGTIPPQLKERFVTPSNEDISVSNPAIKITRATKGDRDIITPNRSTVNGDPNSTNPNKSSGFGPDDLGMGQRGSGGFGNDGTNGRGSKGDGGIGDSPGTIGGPGGPGNGIPKPPPSAPVIPKPSGVTTKVKIISKPKPGYTNEARANNVTGMVRLRVVFTAQGTIGSVSSISGLPNGLTEQAISAAKGIRFEPAMKNGVPITTQSTIEYSFSIY